MNQFISTDLWWLTLSRQFFTSVKGFFASFFQRIYHGVFAKVSLCLSSKKRSGLVGGHNDQHPPCTGMAGCEEKKRRCNANQARVCSIIIRICAKAWQLMCIMSGNQGFRTTECVMSQDFQDCHGRSAAPKFFGLEGGRRPTGNPKNFGRLAPVGCTVLDSCRDCEKALQQDVQAISLIPYPSLARPGTCWDGSILRLESCNQGTDGGDCCCILQNNPAVRALVP